MEFKGVISALGGALSFLVEIETEWNLKKFGRFTYSAGRMVEIETEWNLKDFVPLKLRIDDQVEIETEWNLKYVAMAITVFFGISRDRNRVEFKVKRRQNKVIRAYP